MALTLEGSLKIAAKRIGISLDEYKLNLSQGLKWCSKCKSWQPREWFNKDHTRGDGLSTRCHACSRVKVRKSHKGRVSTFKGHTHTEEAKQRMREAHIGRISPLRGIPRSEEVRQKISQVLRVNAARGIHRNDARRSPEYRDWRNAVYARDEYTCQSCGDRRGGNLQAHHIKAFAKYPELRFVVSNGITLCRDCHERLHLKPIPTPADLRRRKKHHSNL